MSEGMTDRRRLIGAGALLAGGGLIAGGARAADAPAGAAWQPAMEPQDAWLDKPGTRHRTVFDTTSPEAINAAIGYATNFYFANKKSYGIEPSALGVVIVLRHGSTPYGYNDAVWVKYGAVFARILKLVGDDAIKATKGNPLLLAAKAAAEKAAAKPAADKAVAKPATADEGWEDPSMPLLAGKGTRFAVCGLATQGIAESLAKTAGQPAATVEAELKASLVPGALIVPAGIVAINRAQEHGYSFAYIAD